MATNAQGAKPVWVEGFGSGVELQAGVDTTTATPTQAAVASSASSVTLQAANTSRKGLSVFNTDANVLSISYTTPATATNATVRLAQNAHWEMPEPITSVAVYGIWDADGTGNALVTEAT